MRSKSLRSTWHPKYQKVMASTVVTTQQTDSIVPCPLLLDLGKRGGKEVFSISWESSVFSPGTRSSMNTSGMWVTHRERNRTKLCDPPSSVKTPKASGDTGHNPPEKPGRSFCITMTCHFQLTNYLLNTRNFECEDLYVVRSQRFLNCAELDCLFSEIFKQNHWGLCCSLTNPL